MAVYADGSVVIQIDVESKNAEKALHEVGNKIKELGKTAKEASQKTGELDDSVKKAGKNAQETGEKTDKYKDALKRVNNQSDKLKSELSKVDDLLKLDPTNVVALEQKQELLNEAIATTSEKLGLMGEEQAKVQEQFDKGEITAEQYREFQRELETTKADLKDFSTKLSNAGNEAETTGNKVQDTGDKIKETGEKSEKAQKSVAKLAASYTAAGAALIAVGSAAVNVSTQFGSAFAKTQTIMDTTEMSVADMREEVLALSDTSGMAATNVSEAVYQAISGSVATADAAAFVDKANQLAISGFTSLTNATDVLTTSLNAYGLSADAVGGISNVLIQTQNLGKTSVDELSSSMGRAISTGSAYGVNLQNLSTSYVELTRGGIATAEATTYLSGMLNELGDAGSTVGGILQEKTGKSFGQLMAAGWSLGDVLNVLNESVDGDAEALMGLWSSQEAGKASNAIMTQGIEDFNAVLSQMNAEMEGTTGTTENAYATMTSTSEFIDQRFKNSVTNLGIAFGDGLRPALDDAKSLLTDVIGGFTDFVDESPWVSAAFAGMTVGLGAMAVTLTGYTVKAKLAESATLKLTMAMATNPIVLAVGAVAALAVGIGTLAASADDATVSVEEMTTASRNLETVVAESEAAYTATRDEIEGTAVLAGQYVDRLRELENQQSMTAAESQEYADTIEKLRTIIPDLNMEVDEQTGLLQGGADALQMQIDNWYELAVAQAMQDKLKEQIQAQADAQVELNTCLARRERLETEIAVARDKRAEAEEKAEQARIDWYELEAKYQEEESNRLAGNAKMSDEAFENLHAQYIQAQADYDNFSQSAQNYDISISDLENQLNETNNAIDDNNATIAENAVQIDEAADAYNYYTENTASATTQASAFAAQAASVSEAWTTAKDELKTAYEEAYSSIYASIEGQLGLFNDMSETVKGISGITVESAQEAAQGYISSLDSQIAYMDTYETNMKLAAERGIDQGLLQELNDGSVESAEILANMVVATDEQIQEMNDKFAKVSEGKERFSSSMVEYTGVVEDEKQAMVDLALQAGQDMSKAMTDELLNGLPDFQNAWLQYQTAATMTKRNSGNKMQAYASGTDYALSGLALVGEAGPELVYFHGGERVLTAEQTQEALRSVYPTAPQMAYLGAGSPAVAGRNMVQLHASIAVPLEIDGREFARASADYIGIEQEFGVM